MREREARDVGAEPQDGVRWTSPEDGRTLGFLKFILVCIGR